MTKFFIFLLILSCTTARIRRLNPEGFVTDGQREYDVYHSKKQLANLEIFFSAGEKGDLNLSTLKAIIVNGSDEELTLRLKDSYHWSAWYRWQRRPTSVSEEVVVLKAFEKKEVSWVWHRREFGVLIVPFKSGDEEDEFLVKFENCSPWGKCETEFTK